MTINKKTKIFTKRSVATGVVTVFGVFTLGIGIALTGGFVSPDLTKADYNPTISDIFQMTGVSAGAASAASSAASASAGDASAAAAASSASVADVSVVMVQNGSTQTTSVGVGAGSAAGSAAGASSGGSSSSASGASAASAAAAASASASVTVTSQPTCTLTTNASATAISWATSAATAVSINGTPVSSLSSGSLAVSSASASTYTLVAANASGSVTCTTTVTPPPSAPTCTLTASPTTLTQGNAGSLIWTTTNASSVSITSIGNVEMNGSRTISPSVSTSYTLTATGNGSTVHCVTNITVVTVQNTPSCTLSVSQNTINQGQSVTLYWSGSNVTSMTIDQGVGSVNPTSGSQLVYPGTSRTYTATASGPGGTVTCATSVSVNPYYNNNGPICNMTLSQYTIREGEQASLRWDSSNTNSVSINNGIGNVGQNGVRTVAPRAGTYTYQGVFYGTNGQSITCLATLRVEPQFISYGQPNVSLTQLPTPPEQPLTSLYLSDLPYTGLDLGPVGTMLYWLALIIWSIALAYLIFWSLAPLAYKKAGTGNNISTGHGTGYTYPVSSPIAQVMESSHTATPIAPVVKQVSEAPSNSSFEGFKATASGDSLSIEDIVKGLARHSAPEYDLAAPVAFASAVETKVTTQASLVTAPAQRAVTTEVDHNVPAFLAALLAAEKDQVFGMIRELNKAGQDVEQFLTHVVVALDDAYRAKIDGTPVHPEVARVCVDCAPSFLERVISSLTTVVDGSYITGVTGVKLAVTRALHAVEG